MDKSLDDLVKNNRTSKKGQGQRRPGRGPRSQILGTNNVSAAKEALKKTVPVKSSPAPQQLADKIMVSGLPLDVNDAQIKELFASTVGPVKYCQLHFNDKGKWNGSATVLFSRKGDGNKAYDQYNNRLIDSKKPMRIEIMFDPAKAPVALTSRVTPAQQKVNVASNAPMEGVQRTGGRQRRGRGARPANKSTRPAKSAEDLDAEMEDYTASSSAPAAATVAA